MSWYEACLLVGCLLAVLCLLAGWWTYTPAYPSIASCLQEQGLSQQELMGQALLSGRISR